MTNDHKTIEDGFGSSWSITCPHCGDDSMSVVRPGKVQCDSSKCYLMDRIVQLIDRYDIDWEIDQMLSGLVDLIHEERKEAVEEYLMRYDRIAGVKWDVASPLFAEMFPSRG